MQSVVISVTEIYRTITYGVALEIIIIPAAKIYYTITHPVVSKHRVASRPIVVIKRNVSAHD